MTFSPKQPKIEGVLRAKMRAYSKPLPPLPPCTHLYAFGRPPSPHSCVRTISMAPCTEWMGGGFISSFGSQNKRWALQKTNSSWNKAKTLDKIRGIFRVTNGFALKTQWSQTSNLFILSLPPFRKRCCIVFMHPVLEETCTHFMNILLLGTGRQYLNRNRQIKSTQVQSPVTTTLAKRRK